jgi:hypothetical protein
MKLDGIATFVAVRKWIDQRGGRGARLSKSVVSERLAEC